MTADDQTGRPRWRDCTLGPVRNDSPPYLFIKAAYVNDLEDRLAAAEATIQVIEGDLASIRERLSKWQERAGEAETALREISRVSGSSTLAERVRNIARAALKGK